MSDFYTVYVHKNWNGIVSVRSHHLEKCKEHQKGLRILHQDKQMTIPYELIDAKVFYIHDTLMKSKYGKDYKLCDFKFIPDSAEPAERRAP